ncbi:hypothetical protein QBC43DRAFT_216943 [Cladorrhinum sp. PSN259]|nr:hypothetical protein QBC43DRAFT_216943 [Cladorrhinum sp. PSN259]
MAPHIFSYLRKDHHPNVQRLSLDSLNIASDIEACTIQGRESTASSRKDAASAHVSSSPSSSFGDTSDDAITETAAAPNPLQVWWLESLACLLVVSMLVAVVVTIRPYHEKPLPKWPYNLSINTLVAIYFVTLKTALAFVLSQLLGQLKWASYERPQPLHRLAQYDDASRGPWGSLTLLWSFRDRCSNLASGAAIVLVLATILDPFGQQIISFYPCPTQETTTNATVPTAHSLNVGIRCPKGGHGTGDTCLLAADMQAAIQLGMFQSSLSSPSFSCPTGNCVFDTTYGSAGWCNSCADVSDRLLVSTKSAIQVFDDESFYYNQTTITLPFPPHYKDLDYGVLNHTMVSDNLWVVKGYGAAECSIYPCLRKYQSKVSKGNLVEEILSETADQWGLRGGVNEDYMQRSIDHSCLNETEIEQLQLHSYSFKNLKRYMAWLKSNRARVESPISKDMNDTSKPDEFIPLTIDVARVRRECIYEFGVEEITTATSYLGSIEDEVRMQGAPYLQTLSQRENIISYAAVTGVVNRVTQALTNYVRDASTGPENSVTGTMSKQDTCVRVDWAWIAFPSVLVAGMLIMVMATLVRVYTGGPLARQNYKTSVLPLMVHSLDRKNTGTAGPETMSNIEWEAKKVIVRLELTDRGWRFRET